MSLGTPFARHQHAPDLAKPTRLSTQRLSTPCQRMLWPKDAQHQATMVGDILSPHLRSYRTTIRACDPESTVLTALALCDVGACDIGDKGVAVSELALRPRDRVVNGARGLLEEIL
jgi:hypothetical protein